MKERWMIGWKKFEGKHPKLAKWIYQIFYFFVFSMGVTIFQYLVFTFMPHILGAEFAGIEFMWPQIPLKILGGGRVYMEFAWLQCA